MHEISDNEARSRYEIRVDGKLAGFAQYIRGPGHVTFPHTVIDPSFGGHGIGSDLVRFALDDARRQGRTVTPACSFVADFIHRHPDYADLIPPS